MSGIISKSLAKSTQRTYAIAVNMMNQFIVLTGIVFPFGPTEMALFVAYLSDRSYKPSSILTYSAGVSFLHKIAGHADPGTSFIVQKTMEGLKRGNPCGDMRLPITINLLQSLVMRALPQVCNEVYNVTLFKAMFTVAFFGLFRVGELTVASRDQSHTLEIDNVRFDRALEGYVLTLTSFKFSGGKPASVLIQCHDNKGICAVCNLRAYLYMRGTHSGPLFCRKNKQPVNRNDFSTQLRRMLKYLNMDTKRYQAHSFRVGGATYAAQLGMSDAEIRQLGRWRSNAFKKYIRY